MSHYGWSRGSLSPYASNLGGASAPNVTDEDFSYITSQDLQDYGPPHSPRYSGRSHSVAPVPEDDILLIKNRGVTYPIHFPPYTIGDGKLRVRDIRDRIALELDLSDRRARRAKLLYKGRQLKEPAAPIRDYGVKNNSEVMVVLPDAGMDHEASSASDEEMVVVADAGPPNGDDGKKRRKKKSKKPKKPQGDPNTSPRDSTSTFSLPSRDSDTAPSSPPGRQQPQQRSPPPAASGPIGKLNEIDANFKSTLLPLADDYIRNTPSDPKKRVDEHRRISETIMQHTLLKLDEVDTNGEPDARARRKELVQKVQTILKDLDTALNG